MSFEICHSDQKSESITCSWKWRWIALKPSEHHCNIIMRAPKLYTSRPVKLHSLFERLEFLGLILKPLSTIVLCWFEKFQKALNLTLIMPRDASLLDSCTSDRWCFSFLALNQIVHPKLIVQTYHLKSQSSIIGNFYWQAIPFKISLLSGVDLLRYQLLVRICPFL